MIIKNLEIKQAVSIKLLGYLLDEKLSWKEHVKYPKSDLARNLELLFKAKH